MNIKSMKRKVWISFSMLILSLFLFIFSTYAYFTNSFSNVFSGEFGQVDVDLNAYFDDGLGGQIQAQEVVISSINESSGTDISFSSSSSTISSTSIDLSTYVLDDQIRVVGSSNNDGIYTVVSSTSNTVVVSETLIDESAGNSITLDEVITKPGVYSINIVSDGSEDFFEKFRLIIDVKSNIDTYLRIKIFEQLTLTYVDYQGEINELSVLIDQPGGHMPFNYNLTNWYDNRTYDRYIYYTLPVQRINESTPLELGLISSYFTGQDFSVYSPGYSLQIAFSIEAVQKTGGPENVWGLANPPWGGSW
jgi:hypothetical protein